MKKVALLLVLVMVLTSTISFAETTNNEARKIVIEPTVHDTLDVGSKGDDVKEMQKALIEQNFLSGKADGVYGKGTAAAVKSFQESAGLEATGTADNKTLQKLFREERKEYVLEGVSETDKMRIDGLVAAYQEGATSVGLWVFYTVFTDAENYAFHYGDTTITVNGVNTYSSNKTSGLADMMQSYCYAKSGDYTITLGNERKFLEIFIMPKAELESGRTLEFSGDETIGMNKIRLVSDCVIPTDNALDNIAKIMDPEGLKVYRNIMAKADSATTKKVQKQIVGYYWTWTTYMEALNMKWSYRLDFTSNTKYKIAVTGVNKSSGTYEVNCTPFARQV